MVARTASAKDYTAGRRLYGLVDGELLWAFDMAAVGQPLTSHLSGRLKRVQAAWIARTPSGWAGCAPAATG